MLSKVPVARSPFMGILSTLQNLCSFYTFGMEWNVILNVQHKTGVNSRGKSWLFYPIYRQFKTRQVSLSRWLKNKTRKNSPCVCRENMEQVEHEVLISGKLEKEANLWVGHGPEGVGVIQNALLIYQLPMWCHFSHIHLILLQNIQRWIRFALVKSRQL